MKHVQQWPLILFLVFTLAGLQAGAQSSKDQSLKSFREWKAEQISEVQGRLTELSKKKSAQRSLPPRAVAKATEAGLGFETNPAALDRQISQELAKMALVEDLSVSDYFVGYLTKVDNRKEAFKEIAGRLSAEEIAELMNAYANSVFGTQGQGQAAPSAQGLIDDVK